ncbi:hypothetical protein FB45DRAFT_1059396 [Roridomyces roridus]|uniref:Uncharacterized protein n=1 Tax=Roridomyces roridus TaxID=1738132 RepID=A0AAD7BRF2_9AGAR|nr:hypothetical protein FB45DRAFT_1059396 [Roridomyces roridus]
MLSATSPTPSRTPCRNSSRSSRSGRRHPISTKQELAARSKIIAQKCRIPLATTYDGNAHIAPSASATTWPKLTRPAGIPAEVDLSGHPDLADVPVEYLRDILPFDAFDASRKAVQCPPPDSSVLPTELQILINDAVTHPPSHMLAVHDGSRTRFGVTRVRLFPIHELVLRTTCAFLPVLPGPVPLSAAEKFPCEDEDESPVSRMTIPVVTLSLPSLATFPLLQTYLYTKEPSTLLNCLLPPPDATLDRLRRHAAIICGLYNNARSLGVVDQELWDLLEVVWDRTMSASQA